MGGVTPPVPDTQKYPAGQSVGHDDVDASLHTHPGSQNPLHFGSVSLGSDPYVPPGQG